MPFDRPIATSAELLASLERAAALIGRESRWCRGKEISADGRRCLIGALKAAGHAEQLIPLVLRAARRLKGFPYPRLDLFNDDLLTSHCDVIGALAEACREIGGAPEQRSSL